MIGVEVSCTYGADNALLVELLHGAPRAEDVAERLMDEVEVDVVESQPLSDARRSRAWPPRSSHPTSTAWSSRTPRRAAGRSHEWRPRPLLRCRSSRPCRAAGSRPRACVHGALAFRGVRDLIHAEAELRHPDAVVQGDVVHGAFLSRNLTYLPYEGRRAGGSFRW